MSPVACLPLLHAVGSRRQQSHLPNLLGKDPGNTANNVLKEPFSSVKSSSGEFEFQGLAVETQLLQVIMVLLRPSPLCPSLGWGFHLAPTSPQTQPGQEEARHADRLV